MTVGELVGAAVRDSRGVLVGRVADVRLARSGPQLGGFGAALRVHGLVVGRRHAGNYLGYDRTDMNGPWLLQKLFRWLHRHDVYVEWSAIERIDDTAVRLSTTHAQLPGVPQL